MPNREPVIQLIRTLLIILPFTVGFGVVLNDGTADWATIRAAMATTLIIATPILAFETFYLSKPAGAWCRRLPLAGYMAVRVAGWGAWIVIGSLIASLTVWIRPVPNILAEPDFWWTIGFSFLVATAISLSINISQLLGPGVFVNLIRGRYHRPKTEELAVAFIDLKGSTALAERIGTEKFFDALSEFSAMVSDAVAPSGGTIYDYVGDEVIVVWAGKRTADLTPAANALLSLKRTASDSAEAWQESYGSAADFRASLHVGPVVIGEIGDQKRVIALLGDTMNVGARLEQAARELGADIVCSADAAQRIRHLEEGAVHPLPPLRVHGKADPMAVAALTASSS